MVTFEYLQAEVFEPTTLTRGRFYGFFLSFMGVQFFTMCRMDKMCYKYLIMCALIKCIDGTDRLDAVEALVCENHLIKAEC